jgi:exopolysaccharide production protein ExoZ
MSMVFFKKHALKASFGLMIGCYLLLGRLTGNELLNGFFGQEFIFEFTLGVIAFKASNKINKFNIPNAPLLIVFLGAYLLMVFVEYKEYSGNRFILFGLPSFALVLSAVGLERLVVDGKLKITSALVKMGDASYATYLTHWYVIVVFKKLFSVPIGIFNAYSPVGVALIITASLAVGQVTFIFIDRPLSSRLKKYFLTSR